jgi:alkanesulfonate monooxygenase SsuD/methylene tetrahydromethanopterin reductase-like flavin-dependent oxidoreductase (luciferase family)
VLRLLWGGDAGGVSFQGEFFTLAAACSFPEPHDGRILPVHVGGSSLAA